MRKWTIILFLLIVLVLPLSHAHRYFGQGLFGQGNFGTNTNPSIDSFQPSISNFSVGNGVIFIFNVTFSDADLDKLTINWTRNGTYVASNQNLSYTFDTEGVFNITANVSDNLSHVFVSWIVNVSAAIAAETPPSAGGVGEGGAGPSVTEQQKQVQEQLLTGIGCTVNENFLNRLTSNCKVPDNFECDDGENFLLDNDCKVSINTIKEGDLFRNMWFLRFVLFFSIFLLARDSKRYPLIIITLILLFVYNGAFIKPGAEYNQMACMDVNFLINTGYCIMPDKPVLGWIIAFTMIITLISYFIEARQAKRARKEQQKKGRKPYAEHKQSSPETAIVTFILASLLVYSWMLANGGLTIFNSPECTDVGFFINFGECVTPTRPIVGWIIGITLLVLAVGYFIKKMRKGKEKPAQQQQ